MPDLGKYATEVLAAYGVSIALLIGIVWISVARARKVRRQLQDVEHRDG
ncbi:heme exporter protein CcmD [Roseisalinus antarcticus]|uniref:Heme exporter protein D n=1 Tax=Roseisalinus antarcticus TaxID=254357 RepID=A0A1Y5T3Q5_9RHOB|nr:Heme exporter protein D (CcmD) [Roseisalinus antarcticus]